MVSILVSSSHKTFVKENRWFWGGAIVESVCSSTYYVVRTWYVAGTPNETKCDIVVVITFSRTIKSVVTDRLQQLWSGGIECLTATHS